MQIKYWEVKNLEYKVGVSVEEEWFHFEHGKYVLSKFTAKNWLTHHSYDPNEISLKRMLLICNQPVFTEEIYKKCLTKAKKHDIV